MEHDFFRGKFIRNQFSLFLVCNDFSSILTVVIPTLDEEQSIALVIDDLKQQGFNNILVVDGNSRDRTREIAGGLGARVVLQEGKGKADAIRTAIPYIETPYLLVMDGDYTYPAKHIKELLDKAVKENLDEVIGARIRGRENIPLMNRLGNWVITKTFNILFGTNLSDVCSGMYLLRTQRTREINFESKGFSVEVEIAAYIASTTRRIGEVPIEYRKRIGKPKLRKRHGALIMLDAYKLALRYNPVFLIFMTASLILIPSLALTAYVAYDLLVNNVKHHVWAIIAVTGTGIGIQSTLMAIMTLYLKRLEYRLVQRLEEVKR